MYLFSKTRRFFLNLSLAISTLFVGALLVYLVMSYPQAVERPLVEPLSIASMVALDSDSTIYLPIITQSYNPRLSKRIGYGSTVSPITRYPEIGSLNAGWYVDWHVRANPVRPSGMDYVQMIRVHQKIVETNGCGIYVTADRRKCPYVEPHAYTYSPNATVIQTAALANPGSIWLIGNEPDRFDWNGFGQDEMLPELYAVAYKELYDIIKAADPQAKVAIAGIIQATPMRLDYLTKAWDEYNRLYGVDMPVDIWNVHNFVLAEICQNVVINPPDDVKELVCYGAGVVPGSDSNSRTGSYVGEDWKHTDHATFDSQIRAFRQWMKDRGQETKPLIVTEYGVLYTAIGCANPTEGGCNDANWVDLQDPQVVQDFMLWSFDYFLTTKDCELSAIDDCRLVQQWLWFSLDHEDEDENGDPISNRLGNLVDRTTKTLLPAGVKFKQYTDENYEALSVGY